MSLSRVQLRDPLDLLDPWLVFLPRVILALFRLGLSLRLFVLDFPRHLVFLAIFRV